MKLEQLKKRLTLINADFTKLIQQEKTIQVLKAQLQGRAQEISEQIKQLEKPKKK